MVHLAARVPSYILVRELLHRLYQQKYYIYHIKIDYPGNLQQLGLTSPTSVWPHTAHVNTIRQYQVLKKKNDALLLFMRTSTIYCLLAIGSLEYCTSFIQHHILQRYTGSFLYFSMHAHWAPRMQHYIIEALSSASTAAVCFFGYAPAMCCLLFIST